MRSLGYCPIYSATKGLVGCDYKGVDYSDVLFDIYNQGARVLGKLEKKRGGDLC